MWQPFRNMTYDQFIKDRGLSHAEVGRQVGHSRIYLWRIQHGDRPMPRKLALKIWRTFGAKVEPIADATDEELEVLARFEGEAA
jgi:plasmid maintenance system antidote protein VapI